MAQTNSAVDNINGTGTPNVVAGMSADELYRESINKLDELLESYKRQPEEAIQLSEEHCVKPFIASVCAIKNGRRKMEDRHVVLHDLNSLFGIKSNKQYSYYAVFDGHAGIHAASYSASHLHLNLISSQAFKDGDIRAAIREAFSKTDLYYLERSAREGIKSGSTAVCCLFEGRDKLYLAWLGDSQAVLVKNGKPYDIMKPHKPERADERHRIEEMGGIVSCIDTWRVNGTLAVSRAIGDPEHKPYVSSEPDIEEVTLDGSEDFIIMACDGLWDQITPEEATTIVYQHLAENNESNLNEVAENIAQILTENAKKEGSTDNITVIVLFLKDIKSILSTPFSPPSPKERSLVTNNILDYNENTNVTNPFSNGGEFNCNTGENGTHLLNYVNRIESMTPPADTVLSSNITDSYEQLTIDNLQRDPQESKVETNPFADWQANNVNSSNVDEKVSSKCDIVIEDNLNKAESATTENLFVSWDDNSNADFKCSDNVTSNDFKSDNIDLSLDNRNETSFFSNFEAGNVESESITENVNLIEPESGHLLDNSQFVEDDFNEMQNEQNDLEKLPEKKDNLEFDVKTQTTETPEIKKEQNDFEKLSDKRDDLEYDLKTHAIETPEILNEQNDFEKLSDKHDLECDAKTQTRETSEMQKEQNDFGEIPDKKDDLECDLKTQALETSEIQKEQFDFEKLPDKDDLECDMKTQTYETSEIQKEQNNFEKLPDKKDDLECDLKTHAIKTAEEPSSESYVQLSQSATTQEFDPFATEKSELETNTNPFSTGNIKDIPEEFEQAKSITNNEFDSDNFEAQKIENLEFVRQNEFEETIRGPEQDDILDETITPENVNLTHSPTANSNQQEIICIETETCAIMMRRPEEENFSPEQKLDENLLPPSEQKLDENLLPPSEQKLDENLSLPSEQKLGENLPSPSEQKLGENLPSPSEKIESIDATKHEIHEESSLPIDDLDVTKVTDFNETIQVRESEPKAIDEIEVLAEVPTNEIKDEIPEESSLPIDDLNDKKLTEFNEPIQITEFEAITSHEMEVPAEVSSNENINISENKTDNISIDIKSETEHELQQKLIPETEPIEKTVEPKVDVKPDITVPVVDNVAETVVEISKPIVEVKETKREEPKQESLLEEIVKAVNNELLDAQKEKLPVASPAVHETLPTDDASDADTERDLEWKFMKVSEPGVAVKTETTTTTVTTETKEVKVSNKTTSKPTAAKAKSQTTTVAKTSAASKSTVSKAKPSPAASTSKPSPGATKPSPASAAAKITSTSKVSNVTKTAPASAKTIPTTNAVAKSTTTKPPSSATAATKTAAPKPAAPKSTVRASPAKVGTKSPATTASTTTKSSSAPSAVSKPSMPAASKAVAPKTSAPKAAPAKPKTTTTSQSTMPASKPATKSATTTSGTKLNTSTKSTSSSKTTTSATTANKSEAKLAAKTSTPPAASLTKSTKSTVQASKSQSSTSTAGSKSAIAAKATNKLDTSKVSSKVTSKVNSMKPKTEKKPEQIENEKPEKPADA
ncbi:mucin-17-like isoform X1 [Dinothrombium tinctorium]|uniref:Mucin-17-like isoform X1 n=1 Tax=Dinothrombium tinctorium TaxID=1965070 RepID=A0A3S3P5R3_9ACAR|nr:mucin-17-like isoform X1 [Dinothrombium tinctorium]